jgi:hypothetical protein
MTHQEFRSPNEEGVGRHVEHDLTPPEGQFGGGDQQQRYSQRRRRVEPVARQAKCPPSQHQQKAELGKQS